MCCFSRWPPSVEIAIAPPSVDAGWISKFIMFVDRIVVQDGYLHLSHARRFVPVGSGTDVRGQQIVDRNQLIESG